MGETEDSLAFTISLANIFGIFPVSRQKVAGGHQLCFKWRSLQVIHCLTTVMFLSFVNTVFEIRLMIYEGTNFARYGNFSNNKDNDVSLTSKDMFYSINRHRQYYVTGNVFVFCTSYAVA